MNVWLIGNNEIHDHEVLTRVVITRVNEIPVLIVCMQVTIYPSTII